VCQCCWHGKQTVLTAHRHLSLPWLWQSQSTPSHPISLGHSFFTSLASDLNSSTASSRAVCPSRCTVAHWCATTRCQAWRVLIGNCEQDCSNICASAFFIARYINQFASWPLNSRLLFVLWYKLGSLHTFVLLQTEVRWVSRCWLLASWQRAVTLQDQQQAQLLADGERTAELVCVPSLKWSEQEVLNKNENILSSADKTQGF
jgi:hypothetical protein